MLLPVIMAPLVYTAAGNNSKYLQYYIIQTTENTEELAVFSVNAVLYFFVRSVVNFLSSVFLSTENTEFFTRTQEGKYTNSCLLYSQ